jgi:hypothetical protein
MIQDQDNPGQDDRLAKDIQALLREETAGINPNEGLDRFMAAVAASPKVQTSWWSRLNSWLDNIGFRPALASAVVMVQVSVIAALVATQTRPVDDELEMTPRGVTSQAQDTPDLKLTINPDADFASLSALLRTNHCRIIAGPSELGELWVVVDDKEQLTEISMALAQSKLIDDVVDGQ